LFSFFILRVLTGGVGPISDRICRKGITILDMHCAWNTLPFVCFLCGRLNLYTHI